MKKNILLTTTSHLNGIEIEEYLGMVTANQVAGTGFFTDLTASIPDLFGGNSGAYRSEMNRLYNEVAESVTEQARKMGGNAIIGVSIDYDNISAKNMSMFMISMKGTVVRIKEKEHIELNNSIYSIDCNYLEKEIIKRQLTNILERGENLSEKDWQSILSYEMTDLADLLYDYYMSKVGKDTLVIGVGDCKRYFPLFIELLPYDIAVDVIYRRNPLLNIEIIKKYGLFNGSKILDLLSKGIDAENLNLLEIDKKSYSANDLQEMKKIVEFLDNLPEVGKIEEVSGMFGSRGLKYICKCGNKNDPDNKYCSDCGCDIKGLSSSQNTIIENFKLKVEVLESLLSNK